MEKLAEILNKLSRLEEDISEIKKDLNKIYSRLDLRDQYLQMLTVMHDEIKNMAATRVLKKE
ncbi:MAG: hypothetical protein ACOCRX_07110 [Candidatus Woesearchaeota archaeon]